MRIHSVCLTLIVAPCIWLAACAGPATETSAPFRDSAMTPQIATNMVVPGTSTRADVAALLGNASVVAFDSGAEVWVYRAKGSGPIAANPEFVILFTRSGIVKKTRVRPAYDMK